MRRTQHFLMANRCHWPSSPLGDTSRVIGDSRLYLWLTQAQHTSTNMSVSQTYKMWRKGISRTLLMRMQIIQTLWKTEAFSKTKSRITRWSRQFYFREYISVSRTYCSVFTTVRVWNQSQCPAVEEHMKNTLCIYTMEYYSNFKK